MRLNVQWYGTTRCYFSVVISREIKSYQVAASCLQTGCVDHSVVEPDGVGVVCVDEPAVVDPDVLLGLVAVAVHGTRAAAVSARRLEQSSTFVHQQMTAWGEQDSNKYCKLLHVTGEECMGVSAQALDKRTC